MRRVTKRGVRLFALCVLLPIIVLVCFTDRKQTPIPPMLQVPPMLQGLPANYEEAEAQFQARLNEKLTLPFSEQDLIDWLSLQGFGVNAEFQIARFSKRGTACNSFWDVRWKSHANLVTWLDADVGAICL